MPTIAFFIAAAVASPTAASPMSAWADCMSHYAVSLLASQSTEQIVDGGLIACAKQENIVRKSYIHDFGPITGANAFAGLRYKVRQHMIAIVNAGKAQRGYH